MIVQPLKSNIQLSAIIILVLLFSLWMGTFLLSLPNPVHADYREHVLYDVIFGGKLSTGTNQILSLVIILIGAFFVNFLAINQEITSKNNLLPAFFYTLFSFSASEQNGVEPVLVANLFVVPALYFLISSYRIEKALTQIFKAGLCIGIASFFYIDYIFVFALMYLAMLILRPINWRELTGLTIGIILPFYIYICLCYLLDKDVATIFYLIQYATKQVQLPTISEFYLVFVLVTLLLVVLAVFNYFGKGFGAKVKTQKAKIIVLWLLFISLGMMFFEQLPDMLLHSFIIPLSIIIGDYMANIKQLKIANTLLVLFLAGFSIMYLHTIGAI